MKRSLKILVLSAIMGMGTNTSVLASDPEIKIDRLDDSELAHKYYRFFITCYHNADEYMALWSPAKLEHMREESKTLGSSIAEYEAKRDNTVVSDKTLERLHKEHQALEADISEYEAQRDKTVASDEQLERLRKEITVLKADIAECEALRGKTSSPLQQGLLYLMTATGYQILNQIHYFKIEEEHKALNSTDRANRITAGIKSVQELQTANGMFETLLNTESPDLIEMLERKKVNRPFILFAYAKTLKGLEYLSSNNEKKLEYVTKLYDIAKEIAELRISAQDKNDNDVYHQVCLEAGNLYKSLAYMDALSVSQGWLTREQLYSIPPKDVLESIDVRRGQIQKLMNKTPSTN